jgi:hypothetical protein
MLLNRCYCWFCKILIKLINRNTFAYLRVSPFFQTNKNNFKLMLRKLVFSRRR